MISTFWKINLKIFRAQAPWFYFWTPLRDLQQQQNSHSLFIFRKASQLELPWTCTEPCRTYCQRRNQRTRLRHLQDGKHWENMAKHAKTVHTIAKCYKQNTNSKCYNTNTNWCWETGHVEAESATPAAPTPEASAPQLFQLFVATRHTSHVTTSAETQVQTEK